MKDDDSLVISTDGELAEVPVSMQVYQAIYNDITGKTENIKHNRYIQKIL